MDGFGDGSRSRVEERQRDQGHAKARTTCRQHLGEKEIHSSQERTDRQRRSVIAIGSKSDEGFALELDSDEGA